MSKIRELLLDSALNQPVSGCPAHRSLTEVLLAVDKRLGRLEIIMFLTCLFTLGAAGRDVLLPLALKLLSG